VTTLLVAVDLDRTLIYSEHAWDLPVDLSPEDRPPLSCVEVYESKPLSFMTQQAIDLMISLRAAAVVVPVTTRTIEQFQRICLPGGPTDFAVTTNGARLLVDGREDLDWTASIDALISASCAPLSEVQAHLSAQSGDWVLRVRDAQQVFCYAIIDRSAAPDHAVADLSAWCLERNWVMSIQGRKLYCVPMPLTKTAAMSEVAGRAGTTSVAAAGDSLLDAGMLEAADFPIRPAHGELAAAQWSPPGLAITAATGILAGEEILSWLLDRARDTR
jgi:hydroxymethylpyrimidine pyrophosphatase-like HAD family hydrolase